MPAATKPPPKRPAASPSPSPTKVTREFTFGKSTPMGDAVLIYGEGGIGKTTLALDAPAPGIIDLNHGTKEIDKAQGIVFPEIRSFNELRAAIASEAWCDKETMILDSLTEVEKLIEAHCVANIPNEKGQRCHSIEDFGFGKGYKHMRDAFTLLTSDLEAVRLAGMNVVIVSHKVTGKKANAEGADFLEYTPKAHKTIASDLHDWCDHVLCILYDVAVKDGKAIGSGTRTIHTQRMPHFWAKSRSLANSINYTKGSTELWDKLHASKKGN